MKNIVPAGGLRFKVCLGMLLVPLLLMPGCGWAQAAPSLLLNSDFEVDADNDQIPDNWLAGKGNLVTREVENGKHFVRLAMQKPEEFVSITQTIALPAGVKGLHYLARYRCKQVNFGKGFMTDGRTLFRFMDAAGNEIKPAPRQLIFATRGNKGVDWFEVEESFLVPEGATQLEVKPCLNRPKTGTLDIGSVQLSALDEKSVVEMVQAASAAAAEKRRLEDLTVTKKAEDAVVVAQLLAQPAVSLPLKVEGNHLVTPDGKTVWLQGVNVPSLEWSAKGENISQSMKEALVDWKANAVRLPVNDNFWFGRPRNTPTAAAAVPELAPGEDAADAKPASPVKPVVTEDPVAADAYRKVVDEAVQIAAARGGYVILDLHRFGAPDQSAVLFWKDAAARYKNNAAVLFDIFNEPHGTSWEIWRNGGEIKTVNKDKTESTSQSPGMQGLVEAVRSTGAKNIIVAGGLSYAFDLSGVLNGYALEDKSGNGIMYATHFYNWHRNWTGHFLGLVDKYPLLVGETGADTKKMSFIPAKDQEDPYTWVPDALGLIQKYHLNWTGFSFHPGATPVMIQGWSYEPTPFWGSFARDALGGKQFELGKLR